MTANPGQNPTDPHLRAARLQQEGQPTAIAGVLQQVLTANGGGIASLISRFEAAGLGSHAQSWVSTGENLPVSADQIGEAFSTNEIEGWATQAGTTPDKLRAVLAEALPHAVDHVTPAGQVPTGAPRRRATAETAIWLLLSPPAPRACAASR